MRPSSQKQSFPVPLSMSTAHLGTDPPTGVAIPAPSHHVPKDHPVPRGQPTLLSLPSAKSTTTALQSNVGSSAATPVASSASRAPMPKPPRPGQNIRHVPRQQLPPAPQTPPLIKKDTRPKAFALEAPSDAPRYPPNGHVDFFPWIGHHPEDQFAENIIKVGFSDKGHVPVSRESDSAKSTVFQSMKQKSGLATLSGLFTNILAQRRSHGHVAAPSTFKPPPRVTLTDSRREIWLKELANPASSLRKLSRTIPHGVRGRVLLDQCWAKKIPIKRAVWLAKCVGANEIRATKRKGTNGSLIIGGEIKWIRDWTTLVEDFVDAAVSGPVEAESHARIMYALRMAAHLFSEHLLDKDHFVNWVCLRLETSSLARLPLWLLNTQIYLQHILQCRRPAIRLVAALSRHLQLVCSSPDWDILAPVFDRLTDLLGNLVSSNPQSFVNPPFWIREKECLSASLMAKHNFPSDLLENINARNEALDDSFSDNHGEVRLQYIALLDRATLKGFSSKIVKDCKMLNLDQETVMAMTLEWATCGNISNVTRIYVASRLFRIWSRNGIDINESVLEFLSSKANDVQCAKPAVYHLLSELSRSGQFSVSRYLQWLIARGSISTLDELLPNAACFTRLLLELPLGVMPDNIENLRSTILGRAGFSTEQEDLEIDIEIHKLQQLCPSISRSEVSDSTTSRTVLDTQQLLSKSRTIKAEIGIWLRQAVRKYMLPSAPALSANSTPGEIPTAAVDTHEFHIIRQVLECTQDISILADILKMLTDSEDWSVLAAITDTVNRHVEALSAIGAAEDIFQRLVSHLPDESIARDHPSIIFLGSMVDLATRIPDSESMSARLTAELMRVNTRTAAEACSPVSDAMAEALQVRATDFSDEIEKVLSSGNSMDPSTLGRLLSAILVRLESAWSKDTTQQSECGRLLARLRMFDTKHFDTLFHPWLWSLMQREGRLPLSDVVTPLIGQGCVGLTVVLDYCSKLLENTAEPQSIVVESLEMLFGVREDDHAAMGTDDAYRVDNKRLKMQRDFSEKSLAILRSCILRAVSLPQDLQGQFSKIILHSRIRSFLQTRALTDLSALSKHFIAPLSSKTNPPALFLLSRLTESMLFPYQRGSPNACHSDMERIEAAIRAADYSNLPFCRLELQVVLETCLQNDKESDSATILFQALEAGIEASSIGGNTACLGLIKSLDIRIARHMSQHAEQLFTDCFTSGLRESSDSTPDFSRALCALKVAGHTAHSRQPTRDLHFINQLTEKSAEIWQGLCRGPPDTTNALVGLWLPLLLNAIKLVGNITDSDKSIIEARTRLALALSALLIAAPRVQLSQGPPQLDSQTAVGHETTATNLQTYMFDTLLFVVDSLPDDARQQCAHILRDKAMDPQLCYAFGYAAADTDWLMLHQKGKLSRYSLRWWEMLSEPTPNVGENDTSLSLVLFQARKS